MVCINTYSLVKRVCVEYVSYILSGTASLNVNESLMLQIRLKIIQERVSDKTYTGEERIQLTRDSGS